MKNAALESLVDAIQKLVAFRTEAIDLLHKLNQPGAGLGMCTLRKRHETASSQENEQWKRILDMVIVIDKVPHICERYADLIGKNFKTKSGTRFKVIGMVSSTAFGALFVVEYAGGFKFGTMLPKTVEECACQVPLKDMTEQEAREEIKRFQKQGVERMTLKSVLFWLFVAVMVLLSLTGISWLLDTPSVGPIPLGI